MLGELTRRTAALSGQRQQQFMGLSRKGQFQSLGEHRRIKAQITAFSTGEKSGSWDELEEAVTTNQLA